MLAAVSVVTVELDVVCGLSAVKVIGLVAEPSAMIMPPVSTTMADA